MNKEGKLVNVKTGEPMSFELLIYSPSMDRVAAPIQKNLQRMGVTMTIRQVDATQYTNRMRKPRLRHDRSGLRRRSPTRIST